MLKVLLAICSVLPPVLVHSQEKLTIQGTVVSSRSGRPVADALVTYRPDRGVMTDSKGSFKITESAGQTVRLRFSKFGYKTIDTSFQITPAQAQHFTWIIAVSCQEGFGRQAANEDLKAGKAVIFISNPGVWPGSKELQFQKKYKIVYSPQGCELPDQLECLEEYNQTVFQYLDTRYGKKWRREAYTGVYGWTP